MKYPSGKVLTRRKFVTQGKPDPSNRFLRVINLLPINAIVLANFQQMFIGDDQDSAQVLNQVSSKKHQF